MAVAAALAGLQAEAKCPVCLDGLHDPVTIECGHNFCRRCIQRSWAELEDTFPCPVCRHSCQEPHVRSNTQLGRMIEVARLLHSSRSSSRRSQQCPPCERHDQVLSLFCEDDLEVLCALCAQTPKHRSHVLRPLAEAAADHRQRLGGYVGPLKRQVAEAQGLLVAQDRKVLELREHVQRQRLELASDFAQLNRAVDREQEAALARLVQEEHTIHEQLGANIAAFSDHIWELRGLLQEVTERSVLPGAQLLRGIGPVLGRCESLKCPEVYSFQLRREGCSLPAQHSALQKIIQKFTEDVILDPESAHPDLLVSEDRKSATLARKRQGVPRAGRSGAEPAVLGLGGFGRGRRYWEAQSLALGGPERLLDVGRREGAYEARGPAGTVPLELKEDPGGIGVYLDYELGVISFYSFKDRSHIYSFSDTFSEVLKPYFSIGCSSQPLTICAVRDYGETSETLPSFLPS
ncbi:putative tripartite motif-containing protein 75 [Sus scrofa]|uniref:putative tripartite motif-containing protein 75 n=1 Tax=Sus scrofa TaxID=9823 RepID=UPI000A2B192D|nr:putative tripartite motif-containing protein 75 [Sus scrofa]